MFALPARKCRYTLKLRAIAFILPNKKQERLCIYFSHQLGFYLRPAGMCDVGIDFTGLGRMVAKRCGM